MKSRDGKSQRREEERRSQKRKSQKKEDPSARKGRRVAKHCFSNDLWLRRVEKSKSRLAEAQLHLQLQLELHYTTLPPAVVVRWPLQPLQSLQKTQLQPPFGPSVDSLCHPWFTTTNLSCRFPIFETSATALCGTTGTTGTNANANNYSNTNNLGWNHIRI